MIRTTIQSEASECGLASIAMIASAHGMHISLSELRRRFSFSLKGARLSDLVKIANEIGLHARALRLDIESLKKLSLPCILHWDLNHFVVLSKFKRGKLIILDPTFGERRISLKEASPHFTGIALELSVAANFKVQPAAPAISVRQLTGNVHGWWKALAHILVLSMVLQLFTVVSPFFMQWVVDQALVSSDASLLTVLSIGFLILAILQAGVSLLRGWTVIFISSRMGIQWVGNVFAHAIRLPLNYFEKRHLGDITSRMSSIQSIQRTLTTSFIEAVIDGIMALVTLSLMLVYSWKLALITVVAVLIYLSIRTFVYKSMRECSQQQLISGAFQQTHLLETLRGIQSIKISGAEPLRLGTYQNLITRTVNAETRLSRMTIVFQNLSQLLFGVERIAVIWIAAVLAMRNMFSVGMLIAYIAYKEQFSERMASLIDKFVEFRMLRLHAERLSDIVLTPRDDIDAQPEAATPSTASIDVKNLSFRYGYCESWVLSNVNFNIEDGESVAIVGASGCGKTTLIKILLGLLKPTQGQILIGGQDIGKIGPQNCRRIMGVVMQDDHLFAGTIGENISFFDTEYDQLRIEEAAKLAAIHEEIIAMPMGYNSLIGDMGSSLSGGQRQRIILARAMYRNPRLLILDEATSHLDVARERMVNDSIKDLKLTRIFVAHRPETIASADRVIVLDKGKVTRELKQVPPVVTQPI